MLLPAARRLWTSRVQDWCAMSSVCYRMPKRSIDPCHGCCSKMYLPSADHPSLAECLSCQVEALLDRGANGVPHVKSLADTFEVIGYSSWAHRVICSAGLYAWGDHWFSYPRCDCPGFGVPNRRSRVFFLASLYGDARDVLLAQVIPYRRSF